MLNLIVLNCIGIIGLVVFFVGILGVADNKPIRKEDAILFHGYNVVFLILGCLCVVYAGTEFTKKREEVLAAHTKKGVLNVTDTFVKLKDSKCIVVVKRSENQQEFLLNFGCGTLEGEALFRKVTAGRAYNATYIDSGEQYSSKSVESEVLSVTNQILSMDL